MDAQTAPGGTQMESSFMTSGNVATLAQTETAPSIRARWFVLLAALMIPFGVALAIGMATKSSAPAPAAPGSLAPSVSAGGQRAAITPLNSAVAVPQLKAPAKHAKPHTAAVTTSSALTTSTPQQSTSQQSVAPQTTPQQQTQQTTPQQQTQQTTPQQHTTPSSGTVGISHGGG
jgi:hypothetical protein